MADDEAANKRSRARQACEPCRKKKTKCSGDYPKCSNCTVHGFECVYVAIEKRRGPQKGYVRALENRLDSLQNLLEDYVEKISPSVPHNISGDNDDPFLIDGEPFFDDNDDNLEFGEEINSDHGSSKQIENDTHGNDKQMVLAKKNSEVRIISSSNNKITSKDLSRFPRPVESYIKSSGINSRFQTTVKHVNPPKKAGQLNLLENGSTRYLGESSGVFLMRQSKESDKIELLKVSESDLLNANRIASLNLNLTLTKEQMDILIVNYFNTIHPHFPVICQDWFLQEYKQSNSSLPDFLIDAMCSLSLYTFFSVKQDLIDNLTQLGEILYIRARQKLILLIDEPSINTIQAFLMLSLCVHIARGGKSWTNSGIAIRQAFDLGLHRDFVISEDSPSSLLEREARRRLWWCCYITDRITSVNTGRPLAINEDEYDTPFPELSYETGVDLPDITKLTLPKQPPLNLRRMFFSKFVELMQIYGKITHNIYSVRSRQGYSALKLQSQIHHLDDTILGWYHSLLQEWPQINSLDYSDQNSSYKFGLLLKSYYLTLTILLHRPLLPRPSNSLSIFARSYYDKCEIAARGIIHLISNHLQSYKDSFLFFKYYPLLVSFSIHILGASTTIDDQSSRDKSKQYSFDTLSILSSFHNSPMSKKIVLGSLDMMKSLNIISEDYIDENWPDSLKEIVRVFNGMSNPDLWTQNDLPANDNDNNNNNKRSRSTQNNVQEPINQPELVRTVSQPPAKPLNPTQFLQARVLKDSKQNIPISVTVNQNITPPSTKVNVLQKNIDPPILREIKETVLRQENTNVTTVTNPFEASNNNNNNNLIGQAFIQQQQASFTLNTNQVNLMQNSTGANTNQNQAGLNANTLIQDTMNMNNNQNSYLLGLNSLNQQSIPGAMLFNNNANQQQMYLNSLLQQNQAQLNNGNNTNNLAAFANMNNQNIIDPNQFIYNGFGNNLNNINTDRNNGLEPFGWDPLYNFDFNFNPNAPM